MKKIYLSLFLVVCLAFGSVTSFAQGTLEPIVIEDTEMNSDEETVGNESTTETEFDDEFDEENQNDTETEQISQEPETPENLETTNQNPDTLQLLFSQSSASMEDWMPDAALRAIIAIALNTDESKITTEDMKSLTDPLVLTGISNITGIEHATKLEVLTIEDSTFDDLIISDMPALAALEVSNTTINGNLKLNDLPNLTSLEAPECQLKNIELLKLPKLESLNLSGNSLTDIDLSGFPNLVDVDLSENLISELNLSNMNKLESLYVKSCKLESLKISDMPRLSTLSFAYEYDYDYEYEYEYDNDYEYEYDNEKNNLKILELNNLVNLIDFHLNLYDCESLETVKINNIALSSGSVMLHYCEYLETVELTNLDNLASIMINGGSLLTNFSITDLDDLKYLLLLNVPIAGIDFSEFSSLETLTLSGDRDITTLTLDNFQYLTELCIFDTRLNTIEIKNMPALTTLELMSNELEKIVVFNSPNLSFIDGTQNIITDIRNVSLTTIGANADVDLTNQRLGVKICEVGQKFPLTECFDVEGNVISDWTMLCPHPKMCLHPHIPCKSPFYCELCENCELCRNPEGCEFCPDPEDFQIDGQMVTFISPGVYILYANYSDAMITYSGAISYSALGEADDEGWIKVDGVGCGGVDNVIKNTFTLDDVQYCVSSGILMKCGFEILLSETNTIEDLTNGKTHTYNFRNGNGANSKLAYKFGDTDEYNNFFSGDSFVALTDVYIKRLANGNEMMKKVYLVCEYDYSKSPPIKDIIKVENILRVTDNGEIQQSVEIWNVSGEDMPNFMALAMVDAELNGDGKTPLYSNGDGGAYATDGEFKIYFEPLEGTTRVHTGLVKTYSENNFIAETDVQSAYGKTKNQQLTDGIDSAIYYGASATTLKSGGDSVKFSFQERLPIYGTVKAVYETQSGTKVKEDVITKGEVGENYSTNKADISGYTLVKIEGNESSIYIDGEILVKYIYQTSGGGGGGGKPDPKPPVPLIPLDPADPVTPDEPGPSDPSTPGNVVKPDKDESYIEYDENGVPLGTWTKDPVTGEWIFTPFEVPLGSSPETGDNNQVIIYVLMMIAGVITLSSILYKKKEN